MIFLFHICNMANRIKYFGLTRGTGEYRRAQYWCRRYNKSYNEYLQHLEDKKLKISFKSKEEYQKHHYLKSRYNSSLEEYNRLLAEQNGCCAICGKEEDATLNNITKRLSMDHCHKTLKIRGLLCSSCNHGLGKFKDNPIFLKNAIKYLLK